MNDRQILSNVYEKETAVPAGAAIEQWGLSRLRRVALGRGGLCRFVTADVPPEPA